MQKQQLLKICLFFLLISYVLSLKVDFEEENLTPKIKERVENLLKKIPLNAKEGDNILISVGDTKISREFISQEELKKQGSEGYIIKVKKNFRRDNIIYKLAFVSNGNELIDHYPNHPTEKNSIGKSYSVFHILELLGYGFLHPLSPLVPSEMDISRNINELLQEEEEKEIFTKPKFEARGTHLHTQHPIELAEFLNGFGKNLSTKAEDWQKMQSSYESFLEWLVANKQNRFEWYLLYAETWKIYADSTERQQRLASIINVGHQFGLVIGIVSPFVFMQQHSWMLIRKPGSDQEEIEQIQKSIDWLMKTGADFITSEMGTSEFIPSDAHKMIKWFNASLKYLNEKYKRKGFYTKVHISTDQMVHTLNDPWTGKPPINYNFIGYYADKRLGVMPHTVQMYALDDPAPTYGNKNFTHMLNYMFLEADRRETLYYPETAYWVYYDINIPLFLPIYAERRLHDLRLIRSIERRTNKKVKGQINFSSGWEFGYWLNDLITARAAWDPLENSSDDDSLKEMLNDITRHFGEKKNEIRSILIDLIKDQKSHLINGNINGKEPKDIEKKSGIAYLQGWDTWCDVPKAIPIGFELNAQPDKITVEEVKKGEDKAPNYKKDVEPLLEEMLKKFSTHSIKIKSFSNLIPKYSKNLYDDISNSLELFFLRIVLVKNLYDYQFGIFTNQPKDYLLERERNAFNSLKRAEKIMSDHVKLFKLPTEYISSYHKNPTVYAYNYLWTATTLHYWKRDFLKVIKRPNSGPCMFNIQNPIDIAIGDGMIQEFVQTVRNSFQNTPLNYLTECFAAPAHEQKK